MSRSTSVATKPTGEPFPNAIAPWPQSLDYWYQRVNGTEPDIPVAQFYGKYFDNDYMENRFQSMTMSPKDATRV